MMYLILAIIFVLIYFAHKLLKPVKFWQEKDVIHVKSLPIVGSFKDLVTKKKHMLDIVRDIYKQYPDERTVGYMQFTQPFLMIKDLDLIKKITVKDFDHFQDHLAFQNIQSDPLLSKSLISLSGEDWKRMRATLSPVFTSSKMRFMFGLMVECAESFVDHFKGKDSTDFEGKEVFSRFANDVIASTAFGIKLNSLEDTDNEFFKMGSKFTNLDFLTTLKMFCLQLAPRLADLLQLQLFSDDFMLFFRKLIRENIKQRQSEGIVRADLLHLLMEARKGNLKRDDSKKHEDEQSDLMEDSHFKNTDVLELTEDHILAQAIGFFLAGFDTVSTGSCFMAHELALHPDVQNKLQKEIDEINKKCNGKVTYEEILSMKYLDQVICETLRLWPPAFQTDRLCVKDYVIEPILPKEKVVFIGKGISVSIPIIALHRDAKYFPHPEKFDPDRFSEENRKQIIPGSYLPFGLGPRNCIGSRFALLEIKILFFYLLSNFNIVPVEKTAIPLKVSPKQLNMAPENGFQLGLIRRAKH